MTARILIVDDTPLNLKLLAAKLAKDYYIVQTAEDGARALDIARNEKPDLILLDVMMPEMDGFEVCVRLKADEATRFIPIVMLTALGDVKDRVRGLESGADDFLTKPVNDIALMARVRSLLRFKMVLDEWRLREAKADAITLYPNDRVPISDQEGAILLLEDSPFDAQTIETLLQEKGHKVTRTNTAAGAADLLERQLFDVAMVSLDLEREDSLLLCAQLRAQETTRTLPLLLIAKEEDIERVARGLDLGANDYLLRPVERQEMDARLRTQLRRKRLYDRLHENYEQSLSLALIDPLTGAYNRRYLDMHLPQLFSRSRAGKSPLSVLALDLDHFKAVNDTHGHKAGDTVLKEVINRLLIGLRPSDIVVRMGGEEFAVIMPETDGETAMRVAERLRLAVASSPIILDDNGGKLDVTASFGAASLNHENDREPASLLDRADAALYRAKGSGRNKTVRDDEG